MVTEFTEAGRQKERDDVKYEKDAALTCSVCRTEGVHELLYLSQHLGASRCGNCGHLGTYSAHLRADYIEDLAERFCMLPWKLAAEAISHPNSPLQWPARALRKPFKILQEIDRVEAFEHDRQHLLFSATKDV